ncbi:hypothetical protein NMY22_g17399 [Coprinellus aureogranulatus]|nr:hypothetical protein NMY22_g17399 [Coprinellus aureogranulatus]
MSGSAQVTLNGAFLCIPLKTTSDTVVTVSMESQEEPHKADEEHDGTEERTPWYALNQEQERIATLFDKGENGHSLIKDGAAYLLHSSHIAVEFNLAFLKTLRIPIFDPKDPEPTIRSFQPDIFWANSHEISLIHVLGYDVGPGITRGQFQEVMRRCAKCRRICFKQQQEVHRCPSTKCCRAWNGGLKDLIAYLFSDKENTGLSWWDLDRQFISCGLCGNICAKRRLALHECAPTASGSA